MARGLNARIPLCESVNLTPEADVRKPGQAMLGYASQAGHVRTTVGKPGANCDVGLAGDDRSEDIRHILDAVLPVGIHQHDCARR